MTLHSRGIGRPPSWQTVAVSPLRDWINIFSHGDK